MNKNCNGYFYCAKYFKPIRQVAAPYAFVDRLAIFPTRCTKFAERKHYHHILCSEIFQNLFARWQHNMLVHHLMNFHSIISKNDEICKAVSLYFSSCQSINPFARRQQHTRLQSIRLTIFFAEK